MRSIASCRVGLTLAVNLGRGHAALTAPFSQSSSRQTALVQPPVAQAVDTLAVAVPVVGKRAALVPPAPRLAAAGDRQSVRSAEHPSGFAAPISWPRDGPLHRQ